MRALAAAITLFLVTTPALAASPQVEAHVKVFQAVGADANRLKTFCEMMQIDEKMGEKEKSLNCMKQIYEADYGYKDVAQRVESSYQQG